MQIERFRQLPLLGILRGIELADVTPLAEAVIAAGLHAIEVTMNTAAAPEVIRRLHTAGGDRLTVGAGTVLSLHDLAAARAAGASFIVSPTLVPDVVRACVTDHVPVFPGALTPQEIWAAWSAGATMVKVFPASCFGPAYLREIKGPFAGVELLACGGVNAANMADYFAAGASAVAFGGSVFRRDWLEAKDYARVHTEVARLVGACAAARRMAPPELHSEARAR